MRICNRHLFSLFLIALIYPIQGQPVKISGSGNGYSATELRIYRQSDPISKNHVPLLRVECDENGRFSCDLPVKETQIIIIDAGIYNFYLYATEGTEYELILPDLIRKTVEEEQDSYFTPVRLIPEVSNLPSDINNLIRKFDTEYDQIFNRVADRVMYGIKLNEIPALIEKLNNLSADGASEFYRDFVTFRLIMLNLVAQGEYPGRKEDSILINRKYTPENPAYLDLIEQIFSRYFRDLSTGTLKGPFNRAIGSSSVTELKKVILNDGKASDAELQEYIILLNLYSVFYEGSIPPENVNTMLSSIISDGSSAFIRNLASVLLERLWFVSEGIRPPELNLPDTGGKKVVLSDFAGRYLIISFARSDNSFSIAEYGILKTWFNKYSENLQFVTILRDNNFKISTARMKSYGFSWIMLDGSSADMLEHQYDVKLYPSFLLLDPDGRVMIKNCPFPSENLESIAGKLSITRKR